MLRSDREIQELCTFLEQRLAIPPPPSASLDDRMTTLERAVGLTTADDAVDAPVTLSELDSTGVAYTSTIRDYRYQRLKTAFALE